MPTPGLSRPSLSACSVSRGALPLRRLTTEEYRNGVAFLTGRPVSTAVSFPADEKEARFDANRTTVSELVVDAYRSNASQHALSLTDPLAFAGCTALADQTSCLRKWVERFVTRAGRRPPSPAELQIYDDVIRAAPSAAVAVRDVVEVVLQSPQFLYHLEGGPGRGAYEAAAGLAAMIWSSVPDDVLLAEAQSGALADAAVRRKHAQRMLGESSAVAGVGSFHAQWLEVEHLPTLEKAAFVEPTWSSALAHEMIDEVKALSSFVVRRGDGRLSSLLSLDATIASPRLLSMYGVATTSTANAEVPVPLIPTQRSGLLTTGAFLAAHAHRDQTSPVKRGYVIRDRFLCQTPVPPPPDVSNAPPALDPNATTKERFEAHTSNPACSGCHTVLDPIGWGLEGFDPVGRVRTKEAGRSIDTAGYLTNSDVDGSFQGHEGLTQRLSQSEMVRACVATQWFRYAARRFETDGEGCLLDALKARFEASQGNVRELMLDIAESTLFLTESP
jgi:hypothetical protein